MVPCSAPCALAPGLAAQLSHHARLRFDVPLDAAGRNNVKPSSRLLAVANRVPKEAQA
jgi:hypothetical protein